jgi:hypothetical protein
MATLKNTTINDTGYIQIPIGNTAERPVTPLGGMMRYNTTLGYIEWWDATNSLWRPIYQIPSLQVEYLVVGGGGGGSGGTAGGGGAGGYRTSTGLNVTPGVAITVTIGAGGTGAGTQSYGTNGSSSVFYTITSLGGGAGAYTNGSNGFAGLTGGSGGG